MYEVATFTTYATLIVIKSFKRQTQIFLPLSPISFKGWWVKISHSCRKLMPPQDWHSPNISIYNGMGILAMAFTKTHNWRHRWCWATYRNLSQGRSCLFQQHNAKSHYDRSLCCKKKASVVKKKNRWNPMSNQK